MSQYQKVFCYIKEKDKGRKLYQPITVDYEQDKYNHYQNLLYKRVLFGLSVYTPEEIKVMSPAKRSRITRVHKKAQQILNLWKQQLTHAFTSALLSKVFYHSRLVKEYAENFADTLDTSYISRTDFKSLGIGKDQIIEKLIQERILPHNFYELKEI